MAYGIYISAEGAAAQSTRLEHLSNNMANVTTPGFKRDLAMFQARYSEADQRGLDTPGSHTLNDLGGGVMIRGTKTDYSPGPLKHTGVPTDMAIQGDGYFQVRRGNQTMLTRAGNFLFNSLGKLTTPDGYPVLDEGGDDIAINPDGGQWSTTPSGTITQDGNSFILGIARPASTNDLVKAGENLFTSTSRAVQLAPEQRSVMQGYLEQSGVRPTQELTELIETERVFEANVNMIHFQDEVLGSLISSVLKT
jgi:flagellar basal-body rod protein FlgF